MKNNRKGKFTASNHILHNVFHLFNGEINDIERYSLNTP